MSPIVNEHQHPSYFSTSSSCELRTEMPFSDNCEEGEVKELTEWCMTRLGLDSQHWRNTNTTATKQEFISLVKNGKDIE